jgi:hypothetical protein
MALLDVFFSFGSLDWAEVVQSVPPAFETAVPTTQGTGCQAAFEPPTSALVSGRTLWVANE